MSVDKFLIALFIALIFPLNIYAANTPASIPDTIDFAGRSYNLAVRKADDIRYVDLVYVIPPQGERYHNLRLDWRTDEWIFDAHDEKSCPDLAHHLQGEQDFRIYSVCNAIAELRESGVDMDNDFTFMENKQTGEIVLVFVRPVAANGELRPFAELGFNRYINIPVPRYNDISSVLMMQYTVTIFGNDLADSEAKLRALPQSDSQKWLEALVKLPVPQFFIDKGRNYLSCPDRAKDTGEDCP